MYLVSILWTSIINIIKISRINQDSILSFRSQRVLSQLIVEIIYHPNCYKIISSELHSNQKKINLIQDIYEVARWQSQQSIDAIDLIQECEWINGFCTNLTEFEFNNDSEIIIECFGLYEKIFELNCKKSPEEILKSYKNLVENLSYKKTVYNFSYQLPNEIKWQLKYWDDFLKTKFYIRDKGLVDECLENLTNGTALLLYGDYGISRPLVESEIEQALSRLNFKALYQKAYLYQCDYTVLIMIGYISFYERWKEFEDCLNWRQPTETNVSYCGYGVLPENIKEFEGLILNNFDKINNVMFFVERHEPLGYIFKGLNFILLFFLNKGLKDYFLFSSVASSDYSKCEIILKELEKQILSMEKNTAYFKAFEVEIVKGIISNSLTKIKTLRNESVYNMKISRSDRLGFNETISFGFNSPEFNYKLNDIFDVYYDKKVFSNKITLINQNISKDRLLNSESIGMNSIVRIFNCLYQYIKSKSKVKLFDELKKSDEMVFFAKNEVLISYGFSDLDDGFVKSHKENIKWKGVVVSNDEVICFNSNCVKILLTRNVLLNENTPLFSLFTDCGNSFNVVITSFFDLEVLNDDCVFSI